MKRYSVVHGSTVILLMLTSFIPVRSINELWIKSCPKTCTCQISRFSDLSISKSLSEIQKKGTKELFEVYENDDDKSHNNVVDDEEEQYSSFDQERPFLNMAMCVLQEGITVDDFFTALPIEIQVLTILQGPEKTPVSIETTHITKFNDLQVFEVFGYRSEESTFDGNKTKLLFKVDFPDPVPTLQYLHLDGVQLKESPEISNSINVNDISEQSFYQKIDDDQIIEPYISEGWEHLNKEQGNVEKVDTNQNEAQGNAEKVNANQNKEQLGVEDNSILPYHEYLSQSKSKRAAEKPPMRKKLVFMEPPNEIIPYEIYKRAEEKKRTRLFTGFTKLTYLQISNSNLKEIDWQWFDDLKNLEILSLDNNQIEYIPDFTFHALKKLKFLSLSNNKITGLTSTSFAGLLSLEILDLSKNNLMELSDISFPPFPKLDAIDLSDNPVKFVRGNTFEVMNTTKKLYLGGQIENMKIQTDAFIGLNSVRSLEISGIRQQILERDFFQGMSDLQHLKLQGKLDYLAFDAFAEIPLIKVIILRNCSLLAVSMDSFYGLYNLEVIDLAYNNLRKLPPKLFDQQAFLKEVILTGNKLVEIPANLFSGLTLQLIQLQDNPWQCSCKMKNWQNLPISQVKRKKERSCRFYGDKGSKCNGREETEYEYVYNRSVEPRCATPSKFKGWTVTKMLRKGLSCNEAASEEKQSKKYLKHKYEQYLKRKYDSKLQFSA